MAGSWSFGVIHRYYLNSLLAAADRLAGDEEITVDRPATQEELVEKATKVLTKVKPDDTLPSGKVYRLTRDDVVVEAELNMFGYGHTYLLTADEDGTPVKIDVSALCSTTIIESKAGLLTKVWLHLNALPVRVRALGVIEIKDRELVDAPQD